jgi:hypothetical protein
MAQGFHRCYRAPGLEWIPGVSGLALLLISFGTRRDAYQLACVILGFVALAVALRLWRCRICRYNETYTIVNLFSIHHIPVTSIQDVCHPGFLGGRGLQRTALVVAGRSRHLRVTALPGGALNPEVAAFLEDLHWVKRNAADSVTVGSELSEATIRERRGFFEPVGFTVWAVGGFAAVAVATVSVVAAMAVYVLVLVVAIFVSRFLRSS